MTILVVAAVAVAMAPATGVAGERWLASADWQRWDLVQDEFGGGRGGDRAPEVGGESGGTTLLSGSRLKAGGLSLLVPGLGQLANGQRTKGLVMLGLEAAIWGTYAGFHGHAGNLTDDYEAWAEIYAGVAPGQSGDFYQALGRYDDSDAWYESRLREARAFGDPAPEPLTEDQEWQWRSEQFRRDYQSLRADANEAFDRRDNLVLFAIVNRALAVYDAVRNGGTHDADGDSRVGGRVLGTDLSVAVSAPLARPAATLSAGWSF